MSVLAVGSGRRLDPGWDHRRSDRVASLPDQPQGAAPGEGRHSLSVVRAFSTERSIRSSVVPKSASRVST